MNSTCSRISTCLLALLVSAMFAETTMAQWIDRLPEDARDSILWSADHEEGDLNDWEFYDYEYAGGGVFALGAGEVSVEAALGMAHSGLFSARTTITNAFRAKNGSRAVRLMRSADRPWDDAGYYFPDEAYYSVWMYFPKTYNANKYEPWDPGDGGWWNVLQFNANDDLGQPQPVWSLDVDHDDLTNSMSFYLFSKQNKPSIQVQANPVRIPVGRWVHVEAYYRVSAQDAGQITIWQDGQQILDVNNVYTALSTMEEHPIWAVGNHTDHIAGGKTDGTATIYFDDAVVSKKRMSAYLLPQRQLRR